MVGLIKIILLCLIVCSSSAQTITSVAGNGSVTYTGDGGPATAAGIGGTCGVIFDSNNNFFFAQNNSCVRKVSFSGIISTIAGNGSVGFSGDGGPATSAQINLPNYVAVDDTGNLYIADAGNNRIRKVRVATGIINTIAGNGASGFSGDGYPATSANLNRPYGVCVDRSNNIYFSDYSNYRIRKIDNSGIISTVAGNGSSGHSGDGSAATAATLSFPKGISVGPGGNSILVCDGYYIRKIDLTSGIISTLGGNGTSGCTGDGGSATSAATFLPHGIAVDVIGNIYVTDAHCDKVRVIDTTGIISTFVGNGSGTFSGDGGPATAASLYSPRNASFDQCGNLFITDNGNKRIRKVTVSTPSATDTPSLSISVSPNDTICAGTSVTYSSSFTRGGSYSTYQWYVRTTAVTGATNSTYTYAPANGDSVYCMITTWNRCSSNSYATSNIIHMVVYPVAIPTISITPSPNDTVCAGTSVTYTATLSGGGASPAYQWLVNGSIVSTSSSYTYAPASGDSVRCVLTSSAPCATTSSASSNTINMVVNSVVTPTITISASPGDTVCAGTSVTYTATISGGGTSPGYQWKVNGANVGSGTSTYTYSPANGDSVRCVLTSSEPCPTTGILSSSTVYMVVNPVVTPMITVTVSPNDTVCAGTSVTYIATISGGGTSPAYQWKVNGANVGSGSSTYAYIPANGDSVRCVLTSNAPCATVATVSSSMIDMVVNPVVTPTINISVSPNDTVCAGTSVAYLATISGGGTSPAYQWKVNGTNVGSGASTYSYTPANGDSVRCVLTSNAPCPTLSVVSSNTINMVVQPVVIPSIVITPNPNDTVCNANVVIYTAAITGGGTSPSYQWYKNGAAVGTSGSTYIYSALNGDSVRCVLTSSEPCATPAIVSSNTINMIVAVFGHPTITLSGTPVVPVGSPVTITATVSGAGSSYVIHWMNYGAEFTTTTIPSVTYTKVLPTDSITARVVSDDYCYDSTVTGGYVVWDHNVGMASPVPSHRGVTVYPNPVSGTLYIESGIPIETLTLSNLLGQVVYRHEMKQTGQQQNFIPMDQLPIGIYVLEVLNTSGIKEIRKIAKQ